MRTVLGLVLYLFATLAVAEPGGFDRAAIAEARATVVMLRGQSGACSGVVVAPGVLLTAKHCIENDPLLAVERDGKTLGVREWLAVPDTDLAIGQVPSLACPCARVAPAAATTPDEPAIAIGFPYAMTQIATRGAVQPRIRDNPHLVTSTPVAVGASGGGVFVLRGGRPALVGIISMTSRDGSITWSVDHRRQP